DSRREPSVGPQEMNAAKVRRHRIRNMHRRPGFRVFSWRFKSCRHHADHGVEVAAQRNRLADDLRISVELTLPEVMTEHHYKWPATLVVIRGDIPAARSLHSQRIEIPARNLANLKLDRFGSGRVSQRRQHFATKLCEGATGFGYVLQIRRRLVRAKCHQPLWLFVTERAQQHG